MSRILKALAISTLGLAMLAPVASARPPRVFIGGGWGPGWGWYGPAYWGPYYGPYYYGYGYDASRNGEVKLQTKAKDAMVYVDGGYAGVSGKLKKFHLRAGTHNIELRDPSGHTFFQEQVNVIAGKTVEISG
jgi:hypothetical protein